MVEEVPLALVFNDRVVGGPAEDGIEDLAPVGVRAERAIRDTVREEMGVSGRVGEVVLAVVLVYPSSLV